MAVKPKVRSSNRNAEVKKLSANVKLQDLIQQVCVSSQSGRTQRFKEWAKLDRSIKAIKDRKENGTSKHKKGRLDETKYGQDYDGDTNIPLLFFIEDTMASQFSKIFFARDTIFTGEGRTQDDQEGTKKLSAAVRAAGQRFKNAKALKDWFKNGIRYGESVVALMWDSFTETKYLMDNGMKAKTTQKTLSGVKYQNIHPSRFLRDPAVPIDEFETGRWAGHWAPMSRLDIKRNFRVDLDPNAPWNWLFQNLGSENTGLHEILGLNFLDNQMAIVVDFYIDVIPADYDLSKETEPEVWHIVCAGYDQILIAEKANIPEGKYPYQTMAPDGDGFDLEPLSRLDITKDMQAIYNWLFNSRRYAVSRELDGDYLVDPSKVNMKDIEEAKQSRRPSNVIRLTEAAYGMPGATKDGLTRITSSNDTKNYASDQQQIFESIKIVTGAVDPISGIAENPSSRRTAEEIASVRQAAGDRVQNMAGKIHDSAMAPLGRKTFKYTEALLDHDIMVRLTEDRQAPQELVTPEDILVDYDVIVGDGYLSLDYTQLAASWDKFVGMLFTNPTLMAGFNLMAVMRRWLEVNGIRDADQYISKQGVTALKTGALEQTMGLPSGPQSPVAPSPPQGSQ
jgi:hypothetical protein